VNCLVHKRQHKNDARVVIYSLTDQGAVLFDRMATAHRMWIQEIFTELGLPELEQLRKLLGQLSANKKIKEIS